MLTKRRILKMMFLLPAIVGFIRLGISMWFLIVNPLGMPLRFIQVVPMIALIVALFSYLKLYSDGVPVITVIAPTILHMVIIYIFKKQIVIIPFTVLVLIDALFLILKGVKANLFPFDIDGDDEDDIFFDDEE